MLTEKRHEEILRLLKEKNSVTVQELKEFLHASESTIRRDLNVMDSKGLLTKVFGGAVTIDSKMNTKEERVSLRAQMNREEKILIAQYAASLIKENDFVYLDAGTTTGYMISFIRQTGATFVTNAVSHALKLLEKGLKVILIGGELKAVTEAIVGNEAYVSLQKFNFTVGFFGTNGVSKNLGFTTPDINEAMIKQCAMQRTQKKYVLCDHHKFSQVSPVTFGDFSSAVILTDKIVEEGYKGCQNIREITEIGK